MTPSYNKMESLSRLSYKVDWNNLVMEIADASALLTIALCMLMTGILMISYVYIIATTIYEKPLLPTKGKDMPDLTVEHIPTHLTLDEEIRVLLTMNYNGLTKEEVVSNLPSSYRAHPRRVYAALTSLARRGKIFGSRSSNLSIKNVRWFCPTNYTDQFLSSNTIGPMGNTVRIKYQTTSLASKKSKKLVF